MLEKTARGYLLFVNWVNGVCAVVCGGMMMASALFVFPGNWNGFMPLSIFANFPFRDVFFTSLFWPGLALLLVNGVPNILALIFRFNGNPAAWRLWSLLAGILLFIWTLVEMIFVPNALSVFYMVLGVLQTAAAVYVIRRAKAA